MQASWMQTLVKREPHAALFLIYENSDVYKQAFSGFVLPAEFILAILRFLL